MKRAHALLRIFTFIAITVIITGLTFFFLEQAIIAENTAGYFFDPISLPNQIIIVTLIVVFISFFTIYILKKKVRISLNGIYLTLVLITLFGVSLINIIMMPLSRSLMVAFFDGTFHEVILEITNTQKITAILTLIVNVGFIFFVIILLPNHPDFLKLLKFVVYTICLIAISAIIYSAVKEWDKYIYIYQNGFTRGAPVPESFFNNRNPYASFLLNAQIMLTFLYYLSGRKLRRFIFILLKIPFVIAITFTFSKTNMLLSYILLFAVYYHHLFRLLKRRKFTQFSIEFIISTEIIILFAVFRFVPSLVDTGVTKFLLKFFPDDLRDIGDSTFGSRLVLWRYALSLIVASPITLLIGDGPHLARIFYNARMEQELNRPVSIGFGDYHNGMVEVFHTFGLLGLTIYVFTIFITVIIIIRRFKTNGNMAYFLIVSLILFSMRSQTESLAMLLFKSEGIMASLTYILPLLYFMRCSHEKGYSRRVSIKKTR